MSTTVFNRHAYPAFVIPLALSSAVVSLTGTTTETALAAITNPAGAMGLSGALRITALWTHTNGVDDKILRVRLGGLTGTAFTAITATTTATTQTQTIISNRGSASSQVDGPLTSTGLGSSTAAVVTGTIDTSAETTIVLSGELENTADTVALQRYIVELLVGRD